VDLYRMGPAAGPQRVSLYRSSALELFERQKQHLPPQSTVTVWSLETGHAGLALAVLRSTFPGAWLASNWLDLSSERVDRLAEEAIEATGPLSLPKIIPEIDPKLISRMMYYLRTEVFQTTQEVFGGIAGRSSPVVSRWESGDVAPGLDEILRLRAAAIKLGLPWHDPYVLDPTTVPLPNDED
jgi:hypothetical protein